jgi:hypothetical protein
MGGGAWPFLVGEVTCLVNSDNGRDLDLLTSRHLLLQVVGFLEGLWELIPRKFEPITGL